MGNRDINIVLKSHYLINSKVKNTTGVEMCSMIQMS